MYSKLISCLGNKKIKINFISKISNLIQSLVSYSLIIHKDFCRFSGIFIEKTTFEEFVEICE